MKLKKAFSLALGFVLALALVACGNNPSSRPQSEPEPPAANDFPAAYVTTQQQKETINSLTRVNAEGTFYRLEYTADYKLDALLEADISDLTGLVGWTRGNLLDMSAEGGQVNAGGGCSAFVAINADGELIFGRNYDYVQNAQNILVHCSPEGGYESVSIAAGGWLYTYDDSGNPIILDDGKTDLSMLVSAPYLLMDGMNEKGVVICVLTVDGAGTVQSDAGKHSIQTTTALRLVLDRAADVPEAIGLLKQYNMNASIKTKNFHFFIADAKGNYGVIEYSPQGEMKYSTDADGNFRNLFTQTEVDYDEHLVTNFYTLFPSAEYGFDDGQHGLSRYLVLSQEIADAQGRFTEDAAMSALGDVYQDFGETATHETQWSVVYNPTDMTAKICPRVEQSDKKEKFYSAEYDFSFRAEFEDSGEITFTARTLDK